MQYGYIPQVRSFCHYQTIMSNSIFAGRCSPTAAHRRTHTVLQVKNGLWPRHTTNCVAKVPPLGVDKTQAMPRLLQSSEGQRSCSSPASHGGEATATCNACCVQFHHFESFWSIFLVDLHSEMIQNMLAQLNELKIAPRQIGKRSLHLIPAPEMSSQPHEMLISWLDIHSSATLTCHGLAASSLQRPVACSSRSMAVQPAMGVDNGKKGVKSSYLMLLAETLNYFNICCDSKSLPVAS